MGVVPCRRDRVKSLSSALEGMETQSAPDVASLEAELEQERLAHAETRATLESISRDLWDANMELHKILEELAEQYSTLERSNRDLEHFALIVSHDLQEPLRAIKGFSSHLTGSLGGRLDTKNAMCLRHIERSADRLTKLVDGLMSHCRVTMPRSDPVPVELGSLLDEVTEDLVAMIEASCATVVVRELPTVWGDPRQLRQLFQNLVSNAIKFAGDKAPHVLVDSTESEDEIVVSVRDNGIGIESIFVERVFDVFEQLDQGERGEGSGVGLAICRKVVANHAGRIWVDSEPGCGSTFHVAFPVFGPDAG